MRKCMLIFFAVLMITGTAAAEVGFKGRPIINNISEPTGHTLNKGEFIIGIGSIGFGITDRVQVGTNILLFLVQVSNANIRVNLLQNSTSAFTVGMSFNNFNLSVFGEDVGFTSFSPFASFTADIGNGTAFTVGGKYASFSSTEDADIEDAEASASSSGTTIFAGIDYSMSHKTKFLAEAGYDVTFKGMRIGGAVLFGWEKFRLKLGVNYFGAEGTNGFTMPIVGLWWRFDA